MKIMYKKYVLILKLQFSLGIFFLQIKIKI